MGGVRGPESKPLQDDHHRLGGRAYLLIGGMIRGMGVRRVVVADARSLGYEVTLEPTRRHSALADQLKRHPATAMRWFMLGDLWEVITGPAYDVVLTKLIYDAAFRTPGRYDRTAIIIYEDDLLKRLTNKGATR